jgi:hypothetical protein
MLASVYSNLNREARAFRNKKLAQQADSKAAHYFQRSIEWARQIGAKGTLAQAYRAWGNFYKDKGDINKAKDCFAEAVANFRMCGSETLVKQVEEDQCALGEN